MKTEATKLPCWRFDGLKFTRDTIEWSFVRVDVDDDEPFNEDEYEVAESEAVAKLGWRPLNWFLGEIELFGKRKRNEDADDVDDEEEDTDCLPENEYDLFLVRFLPFYEGYSAYVIADNWPTIMDLLARWAPLLSTKSLTEKLSDLESIAEKAFVAWHGHLSKDDCRKCNPLVCDESDVLRRTPKNGQIVRIKRDMSTRSGKEFWEGERLEVFNSFSGQCCLRDPEDPERAISGVTIDDFDEEVDVGSLQG